MYIPHKDPEPPESSVLPVDYSKQDGLTWAHFHLVSNRKVALHQGNTSTEPLWKLVANTINNYHTDFAQSNAQNGNPRCSGPDRSAVLAIYQEALMKVEHTCAVDARKIHLEVVIKVSTVLDLRTAEPNDPVFYTKDMFLSPLEPQYAQPRLNYHDCGTENSDDRFYWTGYMRLTQWRREGWPRVYPARAVQRERREREKRRRKRRALLRETASEGLLVAYKTDLVNWGEEVDADPERPWA